VGCNPWTTKRAILSRTIPLTFKIIPLTWCRFCFCLGAYDFKALIARAFQFTSLGFLIPSIRLKPMQIGHVDYNSNHKSVQMLSHPISSELKLSANALEYSYTI